MATAPVPPTSRYAGIEVAYLVETEGRVVAYLRRRFLPPPERLAPRTEHTVVQGDRLDRIAAAYLGDPEQFWQIADANRAMRPDELTDVPGRRLRITHPDGVPGLTGQAGPS
jgi:nucleoid-associated protein YgaU